MKSNKKLYFLMAIFFIAGILVTKFLASYFLG